MISNLTYFTALAVMPLAEVTALFFVVLLIIMLRPWEGNGKRDANMLILFLPVIGAFTYALNQVLTRKLGVANRPRPWPFTSWACLLSFRWFFVFVGEGRFAKVSENESVRFLLRAWVWPQGAD